MSKDLVPSSVSEIQGLFLIQDLTSDMDKRVGARVRSLRLVRGISLKKLAAQLEISYQQLAKNELGINRITAGRLHAIAEALDVEVGYFFKSESQTNVTEENMRVLAFAAEANKLDQRMWRTLNALIRAINHNTKLPERR
jgi:transcriptional regulator with XRE-family HTH domain